MLKHSNTQSIELAKNSDKAHKIEMPTQDSAQTHLFPPSKEEPAANKQDDLSEMRIKFQNLCILVEQMAQSMCSNCKKCCVGRESDPNSLVCQHCNSFFCLKCVKQVRCTFCSQVVCDVHSAKCNACEKRSCCLDAGLSDLQFCSICQGSYCSLHYEEHSKFNQVEPFKLNCKMERCKVTQGIGYQGVENLSKCLIHMLFLKELRLRMYLNRKQ